MPFNLADFPECFEHPFRVTQLSAWHGHIPLTPLLMKLLKPRIFVELGTHGGDSYLAFCHAVSILKLATQCTAVDTWQGDVNTGPYGPEVLAELKSVHDAHFSGFSRLLQTTFDKAAETYVAGSVDLLHIDGAHTYDAVKHDYQTWLPKMSPRGVILFHDTTERGADFGVWKLWDEISAGRPSLNLPHGHGLGILAVGSQVPQEFLDFLQAANQSPSLVKILESLGARVALLNQFANAMRAQFHCQGLINQWRQRTSQPLRNTSTNFQAAVSEPDAYGIRLLEDTRQLAQDAVNLVAEVLRLRDPKPPQPPQA